MTPEWLRDWLSYSLTDFLLFSPHTYHRLFELYNRAVWPGHVLAVLAGLAIVGLVRRRGATPGRAVAALLAGCWAWVAWGYHLERYATINWAAVYFAAGFGIEALLLLWTGVIRGRLRFGPARYWPARVGFALFVFALAILPLVAPLTGRGWLQSEVFALAPDPTAVGTLGVMLLARGRVPLDLVAIPVLWCAISGLTLWAMGAPDAWLTLLAALVGASAVAWKRVAR